MEVKILMIIIELGYNFILQTNFFMVLMQSEFFKCV